MFATKFRIPFAPEEVHQVFFAVARDYALSPQQMLIVCCHALDELLIRERRDDPTARRWIQSKAREIKAKYPASAEWDYEAYRRTQNQPRKRLPKRNWKAPFRFVHRFEVKPLPSRWYRWYRHELLEPPLRLAPHQAFVLLVWALAEFDDEQLETWRERVRREHPDTWDWNLYPLKRRRDISIGGIS